MTFTEVVGSIPYQPGVKAYNFKASGTIYKGQAVELCLGKNGYVLTTPGSSSTDVVAGVAACTAYHNSSIAIYGKLNMVRAKLSGSQSAGTLVGAYSDGMFHNTAVTKCAVVIEGVTSSGDGIVLLY